MIQQKVIEQLIREIGQENVFTAPEDLLVLGYDSTPGLHSTPDLVLNRSRAPAGPLVQ